MSRLQKESKEMPKVTFIDPTGKEHPLDAKEGYSLMEVAVENDVPGIEADCGGACACATCHIYVEDDWLAKLTPIDDGEEAMVECADEYKEGTSRLACQIPVVEKLNGLVVKVVG